MTAKIATTRLYKIGNFWVDPESAKEMLQAWVDVVGHRCSQWQNCSCLDITKLPVRIF